jgi:hypothetical protein
MQWPLTSQSHGSVSQREQWVFQQVDLIAADLTISSKRQEILDFSVPFMSSRLTVLTKLVSSSRSIS